MGDLDWHPVEVHCGYFEGQNDQVFHLVLTSEQCTAVIDISLLSAPSKMASRETFETFGSLGGSGGGQGSSSIGMFVGALSKFGMFVGALSNFWMVVAALSKAAS